MLVVVMYDITDDKRRSKLHDTLKDFGVPVQLSAFECMLDVGDLKRLKRNVKRIVKKDDSVCFYHLCEGCSDAILLSGTGHILQEEGFYIL